MACHHHVEGDCPVCDRVEVFKQNPVSIVEIPPIHLQGYGGGPLCDSEVGPEARYATLATLDTERFCRLCLVVYRARERARMAAETKAWRARPFSEKVANFNRNLNPANIYGAVFAGLFKLFALSSILALTGIATAFLGWAWGIVAGVLTALTVWWVGVKLS